MLLETNDIIWPEDPFSCLSDPKTNTKRNVLEATATIREHFEQPRETEFPSSDPVEIARIGAQRNALFLEGVFGSNHPVVLEAKDEFVLIPDYVRLTAELFADTKRRFGHLKEIDIEGIDEEVALRNLAFFDFHRFYYLVAIDKAVNILKNHSEYNPGGRVQVPFQFINTPQRETGFIEMDISFAGAELGFYPNGERKTLFQALYDERVPFNFLLAQDKEEYQGWLSYITNIIAALYHGEKLSLKANGKEYWIEEVLLSRETRDELTNCEWVILVLQDVKGDYKFVAQQIKKAQERGVLLVSFDTKETSWIEEEVDYFTEIFLDWLARWEHDATHLGDFRHFLKTPFSPTLLEYRAHCAKSDFHHRHGTLDLMRELVIPEIKPYLTVMQGSQYRHTDVEEHYITAIQQGMKDLKERDQKRIIEAVRKTV